MNQKISKTMIDVAKVDALMYAIESAYIGTKIETMEMLDRTENAFYALWDAIKMVQQDLNDLED